MAINKTLLTSLQNKMSEDLELQARGSYFSCKLLLESGYQSFLLTFHNGELADINLEPVIVDEWDFALKASEETWSKFLQQSPPPMFHDVWAATWMGHMSLEGNITTFMQNHYALWRTLKLMREINNNLVQN